MRLLYLIPVLIPLALLLFSGGALCQGDDMTRAREEYARGQQLFDSGDFEGARDAFKASFDAFPHYRTIFNLALCDEKLGDIPSAVEHYQRYVDWSQEVPNRQEVIEKVADLRELLPPEPEPESEPEPEPEPDGDTDEDSQEDAGTGNEKPEPGPDLRIPGWVTLGTGAAAVVVGGVMLGMARKKKGEIEGVDGVPYDPSTHDAMVEDGKTYERVGWIAGGIGVAALAAGMVMLLVSETPDEDDEAPVVVGFDLGRDGGAVCAGWRF